MHWQTLKEALMWDIGYATEMLKHYPRDTHNTIHCGIVSRIVTLEQVLETMEEIEKQ
jgi:hypothetical protein